jgi:hypothetical protein
MSIRNFGDKSMDELADKMREKNYMDDDEAAAEDADDIVAVAEAE